MPIASGRLIVGRDWELLEGASVPVIARDADPDTEQMLLAAMAPCEPGDIIPVTQPLSALHSREE